jgi:peroxiredoxin
LEALYKEWHDAGLEVVGISFDEDAAKVRKTIEQLKLSYPQVVVPGDEKTRQLWQEATGIGSVPRVFVIDRAGILRADNPEDIEKTVAELVQK